VCIFFSGVAFGILNIFQDAKPRRSLVETVLQPLLAIFRQASSYSSKLLIFSVGLISIFLSTEYESILTTDVIAPPKPYSFQTISEFLGAGYKIQFPMYPSDTNNRNTNAVDYNNITAQDGPNQYLARLAEKVNRESSNKYEL